VALRLSRPVKAVIATGIAASSIAMVSLPAAASTVRDSEWWMSALSIRDSWPVARGAGITIAVLNDGVDVQQPDLTGPGVTTGPDYTGTSQSSGQYFGEIGTGVAALIAGHGYGLDSLSGMLGEVPLAHILSIRVTLPPNDPLLAQPSVAAALPGAIAHGIRYAVSHGASVIDLPVDAGQAGITGTGGAAAAAGGSAAEAAAVKYALSRNVVLVAPAGDDNLASDAPNYPAAYPSVIAVGAFDKNFVKAPWTSHQSYVTVTAAGSGMLLPTNTGTFRSVSGTTYASAVVTGIVAMIQGRFPGITGAQVRKALITGTVFHGTGGHTNGSGYGTVNAARALSAAAAQLAAPATLAGSGTQSLAALASPAHQAAPQPLTHSITRDAVVSAVLLVILLLLIGLYAFAGRRRAARRSRAAAAGWSRPPHSRYPRAAAPADADGMLEFFAAAPVAEPATAMARTAVRTARPMATDGMFAGAGPSPVSRDPFASRPAPPAVVPYEVQDAGSGSPLGPASKAVAKRPSVSGAPPWEEASQPQGELPWSSPAARDQAAHGRHSAASAGDLHEAASPAAPLPTRTGSLWDRAAHARPAEPGQPGGREDSDLRPGPDLRPVPGFQPRPEIRPAPAFQPEPEIRPAAAFQPEPEIRAAAAFQPGPDVRPAAAFRPDAYEPDPYLPSATSQFGERTSGPQGTQPGHRIPDRPGQSLTGRLNWGQEPSPESAPRDAPFPPPVQPEGQRSANPLPVRQPRTPTPPPALSPSGSLWERAVDPKPAPADSEPGSRPIFVWNPAAGPEGFPAEPAELGPRLGDWSVLGRHQEQSPD
jgi:hypothetical protein